MTMRKITCPECGYRQVLEPPIVICKICYADLREFVEQDSKADLSEEALKAPEQMDQDFPGKIRTLGKDRLRKEGQGFSAFSVIVRQTLTTFCKRFWILYPLMFLSVSSCMLTGILISIISVPTLFPELYQGDVSGAVINCVGIAACLFVSLYTQTAFIFALVNGDIGMSDALSRALQRLLSYTALILFMVIGVMLGAMLFYVPGVIAGILFVFAPFVFAAEDTGPITSLSRSIRYVKKAWLRVVLYLAPVTLVVIFAWIFFAYGGSTALMATKNEFTFICIMSMLMSFPNMLATIYMCKIYEDMRKAEGLVPALETAAIPRTPEKVFPDVNSVSTRISAFTELMEMAWSVYTKRFLALMMLNLISYLPHVIHLSIMISGALGLKWFFDAFEMKGQFDFLILMVLPWQIIAFLAVGVLVYFLVYLASAVFGLVLYLLLELAYVYVIAGEATGVWEAIKKARMRLKDFFWVNLYRDFVVSMGWVLIVPGAIFWSWYNFTPFVFALQKEDRLPCHRSGRAGNSWGDSGERFLKTCFLSNFCLSA
jgi:hypothetical protein